MMNYQETLSYIEEAKKYSISLGLDGMKALLEGLGNPQDKLSFIHIAGTNGKGSVLATIASNKVGIIKAGSFVVSGKQQQEAAAIIQHKCAEQQVRLWTSEPELLKDCGKINEIQYFSYKQRSILKFHCWAFIKLKMLVLLWKLLMP